MSLAQPWPMRRLGQGPRAALMVHCSLAHSGEWVGLATHLGDAMTLTAYD
ncbi:alpha/beta hydrolase, partial [Thioclava sp. BHET1]